MHPVTSMVDKSKRKVFDIPHGLTDEYFETDYWISGSVKR